MTLRRHLLSAAAIVLGAFVTSECARLASAGHEADEREARGAQLEELHAALADLHSDDAKTREDAQERILALGYSFDDDVAVALATTRSLEVKARLTEILDRWNQQMLDDAMKHVFKLNNTPLEHRMETYLAHVRTCPICLSQRLDVSSATLTYISSSTTSTSTGGSSTSSTSSTTSSTTSGAANIGSRARSSSGSCGIGADW